MNIEQTLTESADDYFKKLAEFTQKQQEKVSSLIADNQKAVTEAKPFTQAEEIDSQIKKLIQHVNDELDTAMKEVNKYMKLSTQIPAEAGSKL